ncbi:uncharacterized protein ACR2FA_005253 [Aphomia sociella]
MTEAHIGFLYNAAFKLPLQDQCHKILKSYYLIRCKEVSKGSSIPEKYFSPNVRCSYCYLEWGSETKVQVRSKIISKKQRKKLQSKLENKNLKDHQQKKTSTKELVQICSFCKNTTVVALTRPEREKRNDIKPVLIDKGNAKEVKRYIETKTKLHQTITDNKKDKKEAQINLYANTRDIFSLSNKNNTLSNTVNNIKKVIKNNKKKKDKFAGLCQKAVLASIELKEEQKKQNKLNLFLKPSS